ncbi:hypothetical protein GCM10010440_18520 [Kitasatospora cinereorecta]
MTPGPFGALKKTKSASERTLPASVSSRPETSNRLGAVTSTVTLEAASGAFPPCVRTVVTVLLLDLPGPAPGLPASAALTLANRVPQRQ